MFYIKHAWLGYLTKLSTNDTTLSKSEARAFNMTQVEDFLDSPDRDHSRQYFSIERVKNEQN